MAYAKKDFISISLNWLELHPLTPTADHIIGNGAGESYDKQSLHSINVVEHSLVIRLREETKTWIWPMVNGFVRYSPPAYLLRGNPGRSLVF